MYICMSLSMFLVYVVDQLNDVRFHATVSIPVIASTVTVCVLVLGISVILGSLVILKYKKNKIIKSVDVRLKLLCVICTLCIYTRDPIGQLLIM